MGIPWSGIGAVGKAAYMLVREVSIRPDIVILGRVRGGVLFIHRELSRDSKRDTANKCSLELCSSIVHVLLDGWRV
jgi:hypothetical protein